MLSSSKKVSSTDWPEKEINKTFVHLEKEKKKRFTWCNEEMLAEWLSHHLLLTHSSQALLLCWEQRTDCCTTFALVWSRHQLCYDLNMWLGASGGNTWEMDTCRMFLRARFALHFGVCTAAFQLLWVVRSHVRKISEDVVVDLVTWGEKRERERRRRERHPQAPLTLAPETDTTH